MTEKLFPNGTIVCPDCGTTMVLEAKNYESPEAMAKDVPVQLEHHENRCHVKLKSLHESSEAEATANRETQKKLREEARERARLRVKAMTHSSQDVQTMLEQAMANLKRPGGKELGGAEPPPPGIASE